MLKPCGTFRLAIGSLSAEVASGGATCGLSFDAASLSGWPISGEPGGSGLGLACCAAALTVKAPRKTPASQRLGGEDLAIMSFSPSKSGGHSYADGADSLPRAHSLNFLQAWQPETSTA